MTEATQSRALRAYRRYRASHLEYSALQVVGRGLFLVLTLMVAFLFVFTRATHLIAGQNEVIIPTADVNASVDLGEIVRGAFSQTSGSVLSVVGVITLIVSAFLTARALRTGTRRAILGPDASSPAWTDWRTVAVAAAVAILILATWLLTLATSLRRAAWSTLVGTQLSDTLVDVGKAGFVLLSALLFFGAVVVSYRVVAGAWPTISALLAFVVLSLVIVGANYFLLYTYVGALINPAVSAGLVLVFTLLLWTNIVVRAYLGTLAWIAEGSGRRVLT